MLIKVKVKSFSCIRERFDLPLYPQKKTRKKLWQRLILQKTITIKKKQELESKLRALKEAQKTPEDKIKEIEAELSSLQEVDFQ